MSAASIYRTSAFGPAVPPRLASGGFALFANGTGTAQFDSFNVTLYPDPTQYLTGAGRATNSVADHNSNVPTNTRVDVLTSIDGGASYQPTANPGDYLATISTAASYAAVRASSPIAFYRLNEQSGPVAYDSSNNGYTATWNGGITTGQSMLAGLNESSDTSLLFDGATGFLSLPNTGSWPTGNSPWSLECWCTPTNSTRALPGGNGHLITIGNPGTTAAAAAICQTFTGGWGIVTWGGTGHDFQGNGTSIAGTAYYLAATYDGTHLLLYVGVNGAMTTYGPFSPGTLNLSPVNQVIGTAWNGATHTNYFAGSIQGAAVYATALSSSTITAHFNAGLQATQGTYSDTFTSDTHTSYTQTNGVGGAGATWTWDTANSRVVAAGGTRAILLYNTFTAGDLDVLIDMTQAQNSGLVWRYSNASNYYEMIIKDSGASSGANTFTLNKMSGGTLSQLATASITFPTGTHHRARVTMFGGTITAYLDGTQILTDIDGSPLAAGQWGVRNDTGTSDVYLWSMTPQAPLLSANSAIYTKHILTTTDPTVTPQVLDAHVLASDSTFGLGITVPNADYNQKYVSDTIDDLNTQSNYWYSINFNKNVTFTARDASTAPWILQSTDVQVAACSVEYSGDLYRNRQTLRGVYQTSTYTEIKMGDGNTRTWNVANPITSAPTIILNGLPATIGVLNVDSGRQFYYQVGSTSITQDNSQTILADGSSFTISYTGTSAIDFTIDNTGQFPGTLSQAQLAALDESSGVIENIEDVSQKNMDVAAATTYANQLLQRYGSIARTITFTTLHSGLVVGQNLPIFLPEQNIFDSFFLVVQVKTSARLLADESIQYTYTCVASEAAALASWVKMFSKMMRSV